MTKAPSGQSCDSAPSGEEEKDGTVMRKSGIGPSSPLRLIQRYTLKGFPPAERAAMHAAVPAAAAKVRGCSKLSVLDRFFLSESIKDMRYDYEPDLGLCGWTFPSAWYVEIGDIAFDKSKCCDLDATIAHEVSHTHWFTEGGARKLECRCFGCSC